MLITSQQILFTTKEALAIEVYSYLTRSQNACSNEDNNIMIISVTVLCYSISNGHDVQKIKYYKMSCDLCLKSCDLYDKNNMEL